MSAIVLFVNLGFWQLRRQDERNALDDRLTQRIAEPPLSLEEASRLSIVELDLRRVAVTGRYDAAEEVVLQARSFQGRSGHNVLTPLVVAGGVAVIVNRGWVPIDISDPPVAGAEPPDGAVSIVGVARPTEQRRGLGPVDPVDGELQRINRVDIERLQRQSSYDLTPFYLQLLGPEPAAEFPLLLEEPTPGGGPQHLAYAVQWLVFATIVVIAYPILLRHTARKGG